MSATRSRVSAVTSARIAPVKSAAGRATSAAAQQGHGERREPDPGQHLVRDAMRRLALQPLVEVVEIAPARGSDQRNVRRSCRCRAGTLRTSPPARSAAAPCRQRGAGCHQAQDRAPRPAWPPSAGSSRRRPSAAGCPSPGGWRTRRPTALPGGSRVPMAAPASTWLLMNIASLQVRRIRSAPIVRERGSDLLGCPVSAGARTERKLRARRMTY